MLVSLPRRLVLAGVVLPLALVACRSDDVTGNNPIERAKPAFATSPTLIVTNTNDFGAGSLRQAIGDAVDGDVIGFDPGIAGQTILLTTGALTVDAKSIAITGDVAKGLTISGGDLYRVMQVTNTGTLALSNLTITRGSAPGALGGGIYSEGTLTIDHSTIVGNAALQGTGGGVTSYGNLTISNSTVSGNQAEAAGALYVGLPATITLINSTVAGNQNGNSAAIIGAAVIRNSIIAGNGAPGNKNCALGPFVLDGVNIADDDSCGPASANLIVADPKLGPLADNGGPAKTHNLLVDSPAIDGATLGCSVSDDERHVARPQGGACDIGAVEFNNYITASLTVNASQSVDPKTGVAVVTGTLTCSAAAVIPLDVSLAQVQKIRRVNTTVSAVGQTSVNCSATKSYWSVSMAPPSGAFVNSSATVSVKTASSQKSVTPTSLTVPVTLYWGHK